MTSFPAAIPFAEDAVRSLLNGSVLPDKLILYVTLSQFAEGEMPEGLLALAKENPVFEISNYDRDIRSYRKLIPALADFPEAIIVTVDDDVYYHRNMLKDLLDLHAQIPDAILAHRAKRIKYGMPYKKWSKYRWYHFLFKRIYRRFDNIQTGVGGVLYPPHSLRADMMDVELFTKLAPSTDDIWFWAAGAANGFPVVPVPFGHNKPRGLHRCRPAVAYGVAVAVHRYRRRGLLVALSAAQVSCVGRCRHLFGVCLAADVGYLLCGYGSS